jgi:hypothetical protein
VRAVDFATNHPPLVGPGTPLEAPWWQRASLRQFRSLSTCPAVYAIHDHGAGTPVYVGETANLPGRAATHTATSWALTEPMIAFLPLPTGTPKHVLRELESDVLGWHFAETGETPALQYAEVMRRGAPG